MDFNSAERMSLFSSLLFVFDFVDAQEDGAQFFEFPAIKLAADLNQDITNTNIDADDDAMMLMTARGLG